MREGGCQRQEWLGVVRHIVFITVNILKYKLRKRYYQVIVLCECKAYYILIIEGWKIKIERSKFESYFEKWD